MRRSLVAGRRAILASIACAQDRIAVVGARSGGAHGNPRVTTWRLQPARGSSQPGELVDVVAASSQYGGDKATNVGPVTGGAGGFLIVGNRTSGPAVWLSADAREFTRVEAAAGLADDARHRALAQAAVASGTGWTVVGGGSTPGDVDRQPQAWRSSDGRSWSREAVPGSDAYEDLHRVVDRDGALLALGLRGDRFGAWWRGDRWHEGASFGDVDPAGGGSPFVASLTLTGRRIWTTVSDARRYGLWHSTDGVTSRRRSPRRPAVSASSRWPARPTAYSWSATTASAAGCGAPRSGSRCGRLLEPVARRLR